ncbi:PTS system galactose-specific transporter subunit IIB [Streptococcus pneumoniae]|nr:PTS system galactose-specific transporter subunit IIB [Streptococcus pneumoniae]
MIKILAACGAGVNSSHQIKSALEEELSNRGYDVHCDAVMVKDVNEDLMKGYDIFTPIAATDLYPSYRSWANLIPYPSNERSSI